MEITANPNYRKLAPQFDPITVGTALTGLFGTVSNILKNVPLIGSLFRGKTEHLTYEQSLAEKNKVGAAMVALYDALPTQEAKDYMAAIAKSFYEGDFLARFGSWWDGAANKDYAQWQSKGFLANQRTAVYHWTSQGVFMLCFYDDVEALQTHLNDWYSVPFQSKVVSPLAKWLTDRGYAIPNSALLGNGATGGGANSSLAGLTANNTALVILGVLVVLVLFSLFK